MTARRFVLALDQGTTGSRAVVVDPDGAIRGSGYVELPQYYPKPGWVEHDAEEIWQTTTQAITRALSEARVTGADVSTEPVQLAGRGALVGAHHLAHLLGVEADLAPGVGHRAADLLRAHLRGRDRHGDAQPLQDVSDLRVRLWSRGNYWPPSKSHQRTG
jgi:hypothetical protein